MFTVCSASGSLALPQGLRPSALLCAPSVAVADGCLPLERRCSWEVHRIHGAPVCTGGAGPLAPLLTDRQLEALAGRAGGVWSHPLPPLASPWRRVPAGAPPHSDPLAALFPAGPL